MVGAYSTNFSILIISIFIGKKAKFKWVKNIKMNVREI
jgi:hypothetical protein